LLLWLLPSACGSSDDSASPSAAGSAGRAGSAGHTSAGGSSSAGVGNAGGATSNGASAGASEAGASQAGADEGGSAGFGDLPAELCTFHTPHASDVANGEGGAAGAAGAGNEAADIKLGKSKAIGAYLTDGAGRALYIFGSDVPGDCHHPPTSTCTGAPCTQTWPVFHAGDRELAAGLDDALFGDFTPGPGLARQATYAGWPLYTYVDDVPGTVSGQALATLWHAATVPFYNVMLMKKSLSAAMSVKYISDGAGFALYRSSADTVGTLASKPVSHCDAACTASWPPFTLDRFVVPSSFVEGDFSIFVRADAQLQVAYRGAPLYRFASDHQPGATLGSAVGTFVLADPGL
jgi:predicted lipoprotein with Yx(FWY)xxD motif